MLHDPTHDAEAVAVINEAHALTIPSTYAITNPQEFEAAGAVLLDVKARLKAIEAKRVAMTGPLNEALRNINAFFKEGAEYLTGQEANAKRAIAAYGAEQLRLQRIAQAKLDEAAQKERDRLAAQAVKAEASGKVEKAAGLEMRAAAVVAPVVVMAPPKVAGISSREVWKFAITDPYSVPREYLLVDEPKIRKVVAALRGDCKIAGVRVFPEQQIAARG